MTEPNPSIEEQGAAWAAYIAAKSQAEKSGTIADGAAAGRAWSAFISLFTPAGQQRPVAPRPRNVIIFPVHKTRQSGLLPNGAA